MTLLADTCAEADAWATALMVLGDKQGLELANRLGLAVYMLSRDNGEFTVSYSKTFEPYMAAAAQQAVSEES